MLVRNFSLNFVVIECYRRPALSIWERVSHFLKKLSWYPSGRDQENTHLPASPGFAPCSTLGGLLPVPGQSPISILKDLHGPPSIPSPVSIPALVPASWCYQNTAGDPALFLIQKCLRCGN